MSDGMHIHMVDGKQVTYPNDNCPICGTYKQPTQKFIPNVHRTGNTVVLQVSKLQMATLTWYNEGKAFLFSLRKGVRDTNGKLLRQPDGKPMWNQITIRINIPLMKQLITEIQKYINELETQPPKRA